MGLLSSRSEGDDEHDEITISGLDHLDGSGDEVVFPLGDWGDRGRDLARERFETLGVPHRWEEQSIVVAASDEAWAERILDQVEADLAVGLDPDVPQVAYDLAGWAPLERDRLFEVLEDEAIPFDVDEDELFVHEIDERRVDELVAVIVAPDADVELGTEAGPALMGELFLAADRLAHDPADTDGALQLADAFRAAEGTTAPYGMDKAWWEGVRTQAGELRSLVDVEDLDDETVVVEATALREVLRPYV